MGKFLFSKKDIFELFLAVVFVIVAIALRNYLSFFKLMIYYTFAIFAFFIILITKYKEYSIINKNGERSILMYIWSVWGKWYTLGYVLFGALCSKKLPISNDLSFFILTSTFAMVLIVPYAIVACRKRIWKEAIIQAAYLLFIPCYFLYI